LARAVAVEQCSNLVLWTLRALLVMADL